MTKARKDLICLDDTPYYHITTRCVRRPFLCGYDKTTDTDYEHRRQWIVERIRLLASAFAIDLCAYAVMSNHYHLVVKIVPEQIETLSNHEVVRRWLTVFKGHQLVRDYLPEVHAANEFSKMMTAGMTAKLKRCQQTDCKNIFTGPPQAKWCSKTCGSKARVRKKRKRDLS